MTDEDYAEAKAVAGNMTLDEVRALMTNVHKIHHRDPNFPMPIIEKIELFLGKPCRRAGWAPRLTRHDRKR